MNKDKTTLNAMLWTLCGAIFLAVMLLSLSIAGLVGWMTRPVVDFIIKSTLLYLFLGVAVASLVQLFKKTKILLLKVALFLVGVAFTIFAAFVLVAWKEYAPPMRRFETNLLEFTRLLVGFAALSIYELKALLTGQVGEPPEEKKGDWVTRLLIAGLEKLTPKGFFIAGGSFLLLIVLWVYTKNSHPADPYLLPSLAAFGLSMVIQGIEMWIKPRFPRLAEGLFIVSPCLIIAGLYFFVRSFFYG